MSCPELSVSVHTSKWFTLIVNEPFIVDQQNATNKSWGMVNMWVNKYIRCSSSFLSLQFQQLAAVNLHRNKKGFEQNIEKG